MEPENTIRSFKKAEEIGVDALELDVRATKDGEIVVFHDRDLKRLFDLNRSIENLTLAELKAISVSREIPTLDEVLASIKSDVNIEIKVHGIEAKVLEKIKNFPHKVLISSFYPGVLKKIRTLDGNVRLGLNFLRDELSFRALLSYLTRNVHLSSIHIENKHANLTHILLLRLLSRRIYVWTVNTEADFRNMQKLGVDGVFTDHPELMKIYEQSSRL